jgi:hypothetical protein
MVAYMMVEGAVVSCLLPEQEMEEASFQDPIAGLGNGWQEIEEREGNS